MQEQIQDSKRNNTTIRGSVGQSPGAQASMSESLRSPRSYVDSSLTAAYSVSRLSVWWKVGLAWNDVSCSPQSSSPSSSPTACLPELRSSCGRVRCLCRFVAFVTLEGAPHTGLMCE